jgi:hypothetical protein
MVLNIPIILVATGTVVSEKKIKTDNTLFDTFEPLVSFVILCTKETKRPKGIKKGFVSF